MSYQAGRQLLSSPVIGDSSGHVRRTQPSPLSLSSGSLSGSLNLRVAGFAETDNRRATNQEVPIQILSWLQHAWSAWPMMIVRRLELQRSARHFHEGRHALTGGLRLHECCRQDATRRGLTSGVAPARARRNCAPRRKDRPLTCGS
jgi:hypothetical protein